MEPGDFCINCQGIIAPLFLFSSCSGSGGNISTKINVTTVN